MTYDTTVSEAPPVSALLSRLVIGTFSAVAMVAGANVTSGQSYPNKPLRMVTSGIGGGNDFMARIIARGISGSLGQPIIIDNRPSGVIPGEIVCKAPADGYTLLVYGDTLWIAPLLQKTPCDPVRDFSPISMLEQSPILLVVHSSVAANSVKELIALAKAKPGELNYASGGTGAPTHLAAELFQAMAGVKIVRVPYNATGAAVNDLIAGRVQLMFVGAGSVVPHIKSGRLKALGLTSATPSALFPELPTIASSGVPGYEFRSTTAIFAPAKTPAAIINRLNREIVRFLETPEAKEQFRNAGTEPVGDSPEQFALTIKSEMTRLGKLIKDANIHVE